MKVTLQESLYEAFDMYGDKVSIEYRGRLLSYSELDKNSNFIANLIKSRGINKGSFIGIFVEDRIETICLIIGILKAGCVFVPFDTLYPAKRIEDMVATTDIKHIFVDEDNFYKLVDVSADENEQINKILVNEELYRLDGISFERPGIQYSHEDAVYIFFTSGSTGMPKAIIGKNISVLHFINWEIETFGISEGYRISQLTSVGFDAILRDIFVPLCSGGTICIPDRREIILDSNTLADWMEKAEINLIHCTPSLFKLINTSGLNNNCFGSLKYILMAGESLQPQSLANWYSTFGERIQLVNLYGPSETTMVKLFYLIRQEDVNRRNIPIGRPITGVKIIILDDEMNPCVHGTVGELYIRTPYMTHGYYKNSELQSEKFIMNPFSDNPKDLIYKTGDLGRLLPDGNVEFLGRIDRQVKIRGIRVELGEIENTLLSHKDIKEAVVVKKETAEGNEYLCAYIVTVENEEEGVDKYTQKEKYRKYLTERLPDYMIPRHYLFIDKMPVTTNGKLDYKSLPEPKYDIARECKKPKNDIEEKLLEIWKDLFGVDEISVDAGFIEMGGNSLNAMTLIFRVFQEYEIELPLSEVLNDGTIESVARHIKKVNKSQYMQIEPVEESEYYPVSSAQKRMFILNQLEGSSTNYNIPLTLAIEGRLDSERLEKAVKTLVLRHESFRTSFHMIDGEPVQKIHKDLEFKVNYIDGTPEKARELAADSIQPFDLGKAPLLSVNLIKLSQDKHVLVCDMHHIVCDGLSVDILMNEFIELYKGKNLDELRIQYKDFAVWQNKLFETDLIQQQEKYWLNMFSDEIPSLNMPLDYPRPLVQSFEGNTIRFEAGKELTNGLKRVAEGSRTTLYVLLLAIYNILLSKYSSQDEIIVGSPTAGRPHSDAENMIGMFVNTLALKNCVSGEMRFTEFLYSVKDNVLNAFDNQDVQFEKLLDLLNVYRDLGRNPLFDVVFQLRNFEPREKEKEIGDMRVYPFGFDNNTAKFDISLSAYEGAENIFFSMDYCIKLFKEETIQNMIKHFINIMKQVVERPDNRISEIQLVTDEEKQRILNELNGTDSESPEYKTVHQAFQEQTCKTPNNIAVTFGDRHMTYSELNKKANRLARVLREKGVKRDSIVAIMADQSVEFVVAVL
ncbi:amino acid adenylation domain-containing protein, partial [Ruminiclostridium cellobioparum]|uniref:amino acid adenylation domain-containing protein n=1 Tax=Ruminiclostridium cellobioparum TaxID=29355 RepID=UPI0028ABB494